MIVERDYLQTNLYEFFTELLEAQGLSDILLIFDNEDGVRPKPPFLMLSFRSTVTPGMPDYSAVKIDDETEVQYLTQYTRRNMTLYGFGEGTLDILETVKAYLNADIWVDKLRKRNLVIPRTMETIESLQVFETSREAGASFDFDLTYLRVIETSPGYIEDVELKPNIVR